MRPAIIYDDDKVLVEISFEKFMSLLKEYMGYNMDSKTYENLDKSMQKIKKDLQNQTKYC